MSRVLVLNQSYEPLMTCSVNRAMILIITEKAMLIEELTNRKIRTVRQEFPFPSVIRLMKYVRRAIKGMELNRRNILKRDRYTCSYCNLQDVKAMTIDHIIPRSKGGKNRWDNLVAACVKCNSKKGERTPEEAGMKLRKHPTKPGYLASFMMQLNDRNENWKPYLFHS